MRFTDWAGYFAVCSYEECHEREYFAIRESAGLMDVTPLYKYDVRGPDAGEFLAFLTCRNIAALKPGRVTYACWADPRGKLLDDGTIARLDEDTFRLTAADPQLHWFRRHARGFDVEIEDTSRKYGALALQGPLSREILKQVADTDMDALGFFRLAQCKVAGRDAVITRTGYTGDLGYEVWVQNDDALVVYDALLDQGRPYNIVPQGLDALDVARIEAGFLLNGVDYHSAAYCLQDSQTHTPYEAGLGWTVKLDRGPFIGQRALRAEKARGSAWSFVGIEIDWEGLEALFNEVRLPPTLSMSASRTPVPLYQGNTQVGYASSTVWSPLLKRYLGLGTLRSKSAAPGTKLGFEVLVEQWRHRVTATVCEKPFFNPPRKRS
jgi:aminomethyltransferase